MYLLFWAQLQEGDVDATSEGKGRRYPWSSSGKVVIALLAIVFIASLLWTVFIHISYAYSMPHSPQPEIGRIYRITVNHGYVVYVTEDELHRADFALNEVFWIGMGCFAVLAILMVYWKRQAHRS